MTEKEQPTARDIARKTLENKVFQGVVGSNHVLENQSLYGDLVVRGAKDTYGESMNSKEAQKSREKLRNEKKERGDAVGAYGTPSIADYDVSVDILEQITENKQRLSLKDLGEIVKNIAGDFDFDLPKDLSDYIPSELKKKTQKFMIEALKKGEKVDPRKTNGLNEKENYAFQVYDFLSQAYDHAVALENCNSFSDLNELGKRITENYKPKEGGE